MTHNTVTQLPDDLTQAIGLVVQLKPNAPQHTIAVYGTGHYVIGTSARNADIPGITAEELLRLFPAEEYGKPNARVHGLMWGKGIYPRIQNLFCVVGSVETPQP